VIVAGVAARFRNVSRASREVAPTPTAPKSTSLRRGTSPLAAIATPDSARRRGCAGPVISSVANFAPLVDGASSTLI
jgi:hypothetical protein